MSNTEADDKIVGLTVKLPESLRVRFRHALLDGRENAQDVIARLVTGYVEAYEQAVSVAPSEGGE